MFGAASGLWITVVLRWSKRLNPLHVRGSFGTMGTAHLKALRVLIPSMFGAASGLYNAKIFNFFKVL